MNTVVRAPGTEIPFHYAREGIPLLMLPARVNGQGPFEFILDTGNGLDAIALSPELAERLGIATRERILEARFPVGFSKSFSMGRIDTFEIGDLRTGAMEVGVIRALSELAQTIQAPIDGNIGYHFLKDYAVSLDFRRSTLTLSVEEVSGPSAPIQVGREKPLILVEVEANGKPLTFVLDTGASYTCIAHISAEMLGLPLGNAFAVNGSATDTAYLCKLESLAVAGRTQVDVGLAAVDFITDLSEVVGTEIHGVLGHSFWSQYRLTIDYPRQRLILAEPE